MRRNTLTISTTLAVSLLGFASASATDDTTLAEVRARMTSMFQEINPENVNASPIDGWYTVHKGSIIAYVSEDGRYLLQGDLIDLDTQTNLTDRTRTTARRELMSKVGDDRVITFTPEDVKYSVTVFTDVDCTYCRKLHSEIDQYLANGIEIRYVLYPRNGPASRSWNTSEDVWCANDRAGALTAAKLGRGFETQKCGASIITDNYALGRDVGLSGTPAIVLQDGTLLAGYLPPDALSTRLQQGSVN